MNEEIVLNKSSVFAFSSAIQFSAYKGQSKREISNLIKAKGPGNYLQ